MTGKIGLSPYMNLATNGIIIKKYTRKQFMTPTNLNIIRRTWSLAALNKMQVTLIFYANLFRIAPETEVLFKNDLTSQSTKLMDTLTFIVDHLDEPEALLPVARDLELQEVTIKLHVKTLCRKLNTKNRTHAAMMAKPVFFRVKDLFGCRWLTRRGLRSSNALKFERAKQHSTTSARAVTSKTIAL